MASKSERIDMTQGPLFKKIVAYALPVLGSGILQFLYGAADTAVVGRFAADGETALAATGSIGSITALLISLFSGLTIGTNVSLSHAFGSGREDDVKDIVHTSVSLSFLLGVFVSLLGIIASEPILIAMKTPETVLPFSVLYMRITFAGIPAMMAYNYGAAILNARGDTKNPFRFLIFTGALNVVLNLIFVICFHLDVAGVALATVISQYISAILVLRLLVKIDDNCHLDLLHLYLKKEKLFKIIKIGLPAGVQSCLFSVSNVIIQTAINDCGAETMAANTAAANIDGMIYIATNAFYSAAIAFTGQNAGANKFDRVKKVCYNCLGLTSVMGGAIGILCYFIGPWLLGIYGVEGTVETNEVMRIAMIRLAYVGLPYFFCGTMQVMSGMLRGLGASTTSMVVAVLGSCGIRILWIYTVYQAFPTIEVLYMSFPIAWIVTTFAHFTCFWIILNRKIRKSKIDSELLNAA